MSKRRNSSKKPRKYAGNRGSHGQPSPGAGPADEPVAASQPDEPYSESAPGNDPEPPPGSDPEKNRKRKVLGKVSRLLERGKQTDAGDSGMEQDETISQVETISKRLEDLTRSLENATDTHCHCHCNENETSGQDPETPELKSRLDDLNDQLSNRFSQLSEKIDALPQTLRPAGQNLAESGEASNPFEGLHSRLDTLQQSLEEQASQPSVDPDSGDGNELAGKLDRVIQWIEEQRERSEDRSDSASADDARSLERVIEQLDQTQTGIDALVSSIGPLLETLERQQDPQRQPPQEPQRQDPSPPQHPPTPRVEEEPESEWEKQKRKLLENYSQPVADATTSPTLSDSLDSGMTDAAIDGPGVPAGLNGQDSESGKWLEDAEVDEIADDDPEIEKLRNKLKEKLRRAEVEISIERATLHRERHKIEQKQADLEREMAAFKAKSENAGKEGKGRWSRFLGVKKRSD